MNLSATNIAPTTTLYVIGNGFDLACGIKSSYSDFVQWIKQSRNDRLIDLMNIFFSNQRDFWSDIEKALGEYDEEDILEYCKPEEEIDYDHMTRSIAAIEDSPDWIFKPNLDEFFEEFNNWVNSIDITNSKALFKLPSESKYLTFNYTETLENVYKIPEANVLHIHGSRLKDNEYIFGHSNIRDSGSAYADESQMPFIQQTLSKIITWMNGVSKDPHSIIRKHQDFFDGLSAIEHVVVYGHSFSEIDLPYFEEIIKHCGEHTEWSISSHEPEDLKSIESFVQETNLDKVKLFEI